MRSVFLLTTLTMLAACSEGPQFSHTSSLYQATRGVALTDLGDARVGMSGTTCDVDPDYGNIGSDYNFPGNDDFVHDVDRGKMVITSDDGVHVVDNGSMSFGGRDDFLLPAGEYTDAVAIDDGAVVLAETASGCQVHWAGVADTSAALKPEVCGASTALAADPVTGEAWVASPAGVYTGTPDGGSWESAVDVASDMIVFDSETEFMYTALSTEGIVRAFDLGGLEVWASEPLGQITDLEAFGDRAQVLVSVIEADGSGRLFVLDGYTGLVVSEMGPPDAAQRISASEGGNRIALMRSTDVHFYEVWTLASLLTD